LFPALLFSTAILRSGGSTSDFAYLLLLFLRRFLGFSLLRHHKPPSKVKEACTAPLQLERAIRPSEVTRRRILVSPGAPSDSKSIYLSFLRESCAVRKIFLLDTKKIFSSIAHNLQSSKKYFAENKRVGRSRNAFEGKLERRIDAKSKRRRCARRLG
jgi:hypothetical protein